MAKNWWESSRLADDGEEDKWWESSPLADEPGQGAGAGRGSINPPLIGQDQPRYPRAAEPAQDPVDYSNAMGDMMGAPTAAPADPRGVIQRVGDFLKPSTGSVLDKPYSPEELRQQRQAEIDRRLSYGAGPVKPEIVRAADEVRSARGTGTEIKFKNQSVADRVNTVVKEMDRRGEASTTQALASINRPALREAAAEAKAAEWRGLGEWAVDSLSGVAQGVVTLAQLPTNIIAPGSSLAESLRETQKELQAAESDVSKASRDVLRRRVETEEGFLGKYFATLNELVTNPTLAVNEGLKQIPMFIGVIGGARLGSAAGGAGVAVAGRAAPTVALADAIGGGALTLGARAAGATAGGVGASMVMAGGDAAGNTYETLTDRNKTPLSEWQKNPDFQRLVAEGKTEREAIQEIATAKARMAALITAPLGILGYMGAEAAVAGRGFGRAAADALTVKGAAKLLAKENITQQLEEGGTQLGSNFLTSTVKQDQDLLEGVPQAMATAAVTSTPFGALGAYSQYRAAQQQSAVDPILDATARSNLNTANPSADFVSPAQTARSALDVGPAAPPRTDAGIIGGVTSFTPPDSITAQAGLAPIVVPTPGAAGTTPQVGGIDVGLPDVLGGLAGGGGVAGGGNPLGGLVGAGQDPAVAGGRGGDAGGALAGNGAAAPGGVAGGQPGPSLTAGRGPRASDADLLARAEQAAGAPSEIWAGRAGDGYATEADAQQALPGRQKKFPDLTWTLQQSPTGKFYWAGTARGDASGTAVAGAAGQGLAGQPGAGAAQQPGAPGAGVVDLQQAVGGQPGQSGGAATVGGTAANEPAFTLKLAPRAPLRAAGQAITLLKSSRGVDVELHAGNLTDQQKVASAMARLVGKTVTYLDYVAGKPDQMPNGFVVDGQDKNIYLDSNSEDGALFVMMHEGVHALPQPIREKLVTTIKGLTKAEMRGDFAQQFGYDANNESLIDNEIAAFMTQAVTKREDFWQELRTKMGDGDFAEVAKVILDKLNTFITGAKKEYGDDFLQRYATDAVAVRDAVSSAYAEAMKAQGNPVPADAASPAVVASNRAEQKNAAASRIDDESDVTGAPLMFSNKVRPAPKASDYDPKVDNYVSPKTAEFLPAELVERAKGYVSQFRAEATPVQISGADRIKAEGLLRPRLQLAQEAKLDYDQKILDIAQRTGAIGQKLAPVKGMKRAAEKLTIDEKFNVDNMKDLLRSTIVVDSYADAPAVVDEIRKDFEILRVKNRTDIEMQGGGVDNQGFLSSGYGDVLINVRTPNGTLAEIQINVPEMLAAKGEEGHSLYEIERDQPKGSAAREAVIQAQTEYYREAAAAAERRKNASSEGAAERGMAERSSSSPVASSSLNTLPSGNLTQSSPEKSATNSQPGGKEEGTFIEGAPDNATISQSQYPGGASAPRRGAERVGDFDVRTMKDGSIVVYGDSQEIRSQIPEDVKGRVTKDGIVFTNAAAPRVKAALSGRKTAYSRGGQVTEKLPMKDGKYIGAPEKYNTPGKIVALRKQLRKLTVEGERGRYWYENSSRAVRDMVGGNVQEARKFVALLAIYSPQAKVDANSTFALRAWAQYRAGQPISVKTGVMDAKAQAALDDVDAFWSGEKTGNFFFNLLREIDPSTAGKQGATIDMWMMRAAEYDSDAPTATQYSFMENETNRIAQEMGWEPQQVQAAIWVAMKARMENSGVKKRTEATSEKKGWIRFDYPLKNGRPIKTRVILNAKAHRDNWLKHAMEHVPTKEDTEQAKFDFSDGVRRHIGQISWEARPGRSTGVLPGVNDAPYEQQVEFQQAVQKALLDDDGIDLLAYKLGLLVDGPDILAPGIWQGEVAAGMQKQVAMAPAKGEDGKTSLDPAQKVALDAYSATLGLLLRQEGVGYHRPFYKGTVKGANGVDISVGRTFTPQEAQALWGAINERMNAAGVANWEDAAGMISSPTGIRVVNFGALPDNVKFHDLVEDAASTLAINELEIVLFSSDGDLITNDWKNNPNGESYQQRIGAAGSPDLLGWARDVLAPRVQAVFEEFSSRYGWGDPGKIRFSNRLGSDAAGGGRDRGVGQEDLQGSVTPSYGTPREGASSAVGYHYSRQSRATLSSSMYGTGLRGAEMERLRDADPRLKQRVYFYIDRGTGINPESGVGGYAHRVNLQNLYDVDEDALRLRRDTDGFNAFEVAVLDAGFDGYMVRDAGPSGNAVLLGQHTVSVEELGSAGRMRTADVVPAARDRVLSDAEKIAANKSLPSGQVTGKQWATMIKAMMPEVYERLAGNPVWQSDKTMYRSELAKEIRDAAPTLTASNRMLPKVSPQSVLDDDIGLASRNLEQAIYNLRAGRPVPNKLVIGRLPHVLNMLGARTQEFDIASSIVKKVFIEKHKEDFGGVNVRDFVRALYQPAMVLRSKDGAAREYELVLPITGDKGAVIVPIKVSVDKADPLGAVMSAYQKEVSTANNPKEMTVMRRVNEGNLLYVDPALAKRAVTGRKPGDERADTKLNDSFVSWGSVWPKLEKLIADRRVKTDVNLMGWVGDNYKPSSSPDGWRDAPSFSNRVSGTPTIEDIPLAELRGRNITMPVRVEETGETGTLKVDASVMLEDINERESAMQRLLECLRK